MDFDFQKSLEKKFNSKNTKERSTISQFRASSKQIQAKIEQSKLKKI